ncbi:hypothetical protein T9A_01783 [Alcanivorax jadensis T9]|jgi:hypothetical protein|uniref:Lipoprotein n=1 Tax=Alcanivorax jadensis T9 TaxID=1177181 RepID=A0ABR4WD00_9GAMM|nr:MULTISPECIES: YecR family lipoprotein [Alcanivorax]KGD61334.1 hypothetical protein T9A_01783 [Alcanivorax jadensis T9]MAC13091.1 hypothetical protein [Alcanivorax sp.]MBG33980.1 hypothetical protein [Alcanivorax sp.]MBP23167.1 hypothetical protein [Alcanivorax sp.]MDF1638601.1 YecR family lipoprotein [Alcanivorax jadensis]|tara:strand:+ start:93 stop:419 length:327 start_codon:yes stop_codon:yes gene_type:complete
MTRLSALFIAALLAGCAAPSAMMVSDGNQSEGTVVMSYDYSLMQSPKVDWQQGLQKASAQCQSWGYNGALPSDTPSKSCKTETQDGDCIAWTLSTTFQCTAKAQQSQQ